MVEINKSRRKALKAMTSGITTVGIVGRALASPKIATATQSELMGSNTTMLNRSPVNLPDTVDYEREGYGCIFWESSEWNNGGWEHDFSVSGAAASEEHSILGGEIYGQRYSVNYPNGSLLISEDEDDIGVYPEHGSGSDQLAPSWTIPLMEAAVGSLTLGASWLLAAGNAMREKLGPAEGYQLPNFQYTDIHGGITAWAECCHYGTFQIDSSSDEKPTVETETSFATTHTAGGHTTWRSLEMEAILNDPYECPARPCPNSMNKETDFALTNPEEMDEVELETWGIKKVETSSLSDIGLASTKYEAEERIPEYIATKSPFRVSHVDHKVWGTDKAGNELNHTEFKEIFEDA